MEDIRQPNAVYKFEGATVRVYGNCSNIQAETEKFLKRVIHIRQNGQKPVAIHNGTSGNPDQTI